MECLSLVAYEKARTYMAHHARPLERELFLYQHEGCSALGVVEALEAFQNPDGGFGNALESDYRAGASSVLATCIALARLNEVGTIEAHPLAVGGIRYLRDAFEPQDARWKIVPGDGEDEPHAPWWSKEGLEETFHGFRINPIAEVLAQLFNLGSPDSQRFASSLLPLLRERVVSAGSLSPSEVECLLSLHRSRMVDSLMRAFLEDFLPTCVEAQVEKDPLQWGDYCLKPLWAVPDPQGPGAAELRETLDLALAFEIHSQAEDGAWDPHWNWAGAYPAHWPKAREEWRGWLTLKTVSALRAHGRIAS